MSITQTTVEDQPVRLFTLENEQCRALLTDLGARLLELHVPDRAGETADVVLGRPTFGDTLTDPAYMGATVGRYAGRLRSGRFQLDQVGYQLATNEGTNHLHGGHWGFDKHVWNAVARPDRDEVVFSLLSGDGDEGFPGTLSTQVSYRLEGTTLTITMTAHTNRPTIVRLVNHSYWNLGGHDSGDILQHVLQLNASHYIPVDADLLPDGEVRPVENTAHDFRVGKAIRRDNSRVLNFGAGRAAAGSAGYDDIWVLDGAGMRVVGTLTDSHSGRRLELATDQPGLCLYAGGYLDGLTAKRSSTPYRSFAGLTLETTGFPDDANVAHFPSPVLRPDRTYTHCTRLAFSAT